MLRQRTGSTVCPGCGSLVGVNDETCYSCGRRNPALWGFAPVLRRLGQDLGFAQAVVVVSVGLYLAMLAASENPFRARNLFNLLAPDGAVAYIFGASGAFPVFEMGRWWTLLSAGWLHGSLLHILFNMLWVRQLAPATAELYGPGRMMIIYTVSSITGFGLSSVMGHYFGDLPLLGGAQFTLGASAPIFGLLGALVYYGRRTGSSYVGAQALQYAAILFAFGLFMNGVDNYAHAGGFAGGWLVARWLDPMTRERVDHLIGGLLCIVATFVAVALSILTGLGIVQL
ncbi:MAG TPA: rhomboid family intramembrane serine protease [Vicinamibacterales bacterium]